MTWIPDLNTGQGMFALLALFLICVTLYNVVSVLARRGALDEDALAERIEAAVKDAAVDLLDALGSVEDVTTRAADALDRIDERHADQVHPVRTLPDFSKD